MTDTSRLHITAPDSAARTSYAWPGAAPPSNWTPTALERAEQSYTSRGTAGAKRAVYGRTTGVGANRHEVVDPDAADQHGLRLLAATRAGTGDTAPDSLVRAALVIRLNQLAAAGSGVHPRLLRAWRRRCASAPYRWSHTRGAIGTGDLSALAEIGLTLAGERPWAVGSLEPVPISPGDALAFISSNAVHPGRVGARLARPAHAAARQPRGRRPVLLRARRLTRGVLRRGPRPAPAPRLGALRRRDAPHALGGRRAGPGGRSRTRSGCGPSRRSTGPRWTRPTRWRTVLAIDIERRRREPADRHRNGRRLPPRPLLHRTPRPRARRAAGRAAPRRRTLRGPPERPGRAGTDRPAAVPAAGPQAAPGS